MLDCRYGVFRLKGSPFFFFFFVSKHIPRHCGQTTQFVFHLFFFFFSHVISTKSHLSFKVPHLKQGLLSCTSASQSMAMQNRLDCRHSVRLHDSQETWITGLVRLWSVRLSSEITASKSAIMHLVCVMIMYTLYEMYKDVASPRSSYGIFLECRGSWWCKEVSWR